MGFIRWDRDQRLSQGTTREDIGYTPIKRAISMFKKLVLLVKRNEIASEAFRLHWAGPHADLILPIIRFFPDRKKVKYTQNRVIDALFKTPSDEGAFSVDGIVELHVPTASPSGEAVATGAVRKMLEDEKRFLRGLTECVVEPEGPDVNDRDFVKVMIIAERERTVPKSDFASATRHAFGSGFAGLVQVCFNWTVSVLYRDGLWHEPTAPDAFIELWFDSKVSAEQAVAQGTLAAKKAWGRASAFLMDDFRVL
jgi:hypothetical protein